uniref:Uncharacterized protein n=1 Tax=Arundo donax TaxID=35708 RepID=A0A0A9BHJ7_ARUDO
MIHPLLLSRHQNMHCSFNRQI